MSKLWSGSSAEPAGLNAKGSTGTLGSVSQQLLLSVGWDSALQSEITRAKIK